LQGEHGNLLYEPGLRSKLGLSSDLPLRQAGRVRTKRNERKRPGKTDRGKPARQETVLPLGSLQEAAEFAMTEPNCLERLGLRHGDALIPYCGHGSHRRLLREMVSDGTPRLAEFSRGRRKILSAKASRLIESAA